VCRAEPAAHGEIESGEPAAFDDGDEAEIMGKDVDVVDRRNRDGRLEFARQVIRSQNLLSLLLGRDSCAVEPDFVVCTAVRQEVRGESRRPSQDFAVRG
jgi:hypothetical protein